MLAALFGFLVRLASTVRWNLKEAGCGKATNPRANLWSDEQKPHKRLYMRVSLQDKMKPNSYTES